MEPPSFPAAALHTVRAAPGSAASLCLPLPAGTPPFLFTWSRAGASLDDRFTTSDDGGGVRLTVSTARTGDSGVYTLQASNAAGSDTTKVRLEVSADEAPTGDDPPTFLRRLQDLTVKVGTRTRFLVEILSSTECKVTWYRNERRLMEAERVSLARDGNFWCADVAAVSVDDAGRWTCTAENAGGRASCSAHLNVLVPKAYKRPEFVEELRALLTEQGTVSLECKVVGVPTPVLRWFKDSCEIKAGDVFALTANAEDPTSLGTYTCEAVNCMGRAYSSSKVHVVGHGSREGSAKPSSSGVIPEPPPIFTKELEDQAVRICEPITLSCQLVVPPWPRSVVWYNKEGKIEPGERYHVLEDGVGGYLLEVVSSEWQDEGEWKCVATSSGGRVGISTCFVTMDVPKNYRKPRFMENLQAVLTEEGLVSFECKVVGFPTPVLSWFKDGQELKPGDVYQLTGTNSLGSYCCIARNCMGQASSSAELTVEDIQNQLNEEEKLQLFSKNQAPKFIQGLKSVEVKIDEPFRFTIKVAIPPEPSVLWYRDDQPVDESNRCHHGKEERGVFYLDIQSLEFLDQAEWKCVAINDFGHSVTSCFLKLIIPRHYKKPRFLENLQAILSEEGAVNLECKVIGVPQPVLKWYKDGEELKPGDIHRIISGQDGTCCLGTYTCEAQNCMGIAASSASLLGFDDSMKIKKKKSEEQALQRNLSLSTIHEERTSQMYDTPVGDITEDKGEISFSFDGKEVSVSLYETPDLTEEEALQIVEMYADQLSENVTEHNVVELPPLRFVKETSTSGNLLMEAIIIDVSPDYFPSHDEDLRTEADVDDISIIEENCQPNLSLDQDLDIAGEDYLEKTMILLSEEKGYKIARKKSDSQKSVDDYFSLSREHSFSEEKKDDDTQVMSESDLQSFASAKSLEKQKSKSPKPCEVRNEAIDPTKPILINDEIQIQDDKSIPKKEHRKSRSRRSSSGSEKYHSRVNDGSIQTQEELNKAVVYKSEPLQIEEKHSVVQQDKVLQESLDTKDDKLLRQTVGATIETLDISDSEHKGTQITSDEFKNIITNVGQCLSKIMNNIESIEKDIIIKSQQMSSAATASKSLEIISSIITPLSEIHSITDAAKDSTADKAVASALFNTIAKPLKVLQQSLTIVEKCIDVQSDNKTLVQKTCVAFIETCSEDILKIVSEINAVATKNYISLDAKTLKEIEAVNDEVNAVIKFSIDTIRTKNLLNEASTIPDVTIEVKHLKETQKTLFELKGAINSLLNIVDTAETGKIEIITTVRTTHVILDNMSVAIRDLQTALEQIENLSIKESNSSLPKYNTHIVESIMDSVLKLRSSFEKLSIENRDSMKLELKETLENIKMNLKLIGSHIDNFYNTFGVFDILQSDNKLDILQKMAQILIALENNLTMLESLPEVKTCMDMIHKNLTKVLENVIESNEVKKYCVLVEICDAVNRVNNSINYIDSGNTLCLASIQNSLKIIEDKLINNVFESELNCSLLTNINDTLIAIQKVINKAEEFSICFDSDRVQELSSLKVFKSKIVIEHINRTIAAIDSVRFLETVSEYKEIFFPILENIRPVLEELKNNIASASNTILQEENVSVILSNAFVKSLANPLYEINHNLLVLSQTIIENTDNIKYSNEISTKFAEPLHELHKALEILHQDVISQYGEDLTPYEVSLNYASAVNNLQSCIIMVQEQAGIEGTDDMSTLEDISGIKTSAETVASDRLVVPSSEVTVPELRVHEFETEEIKSTAAEVLQILNEHLTVLQNPEIIEALETLSEISELSSLKSVVIGLGELHTGIEEIVHPVLVDTSDDMLNLVNTSKLLAIAEPMQELQNHLSVLDINNIPIYENAIDLPTGQASKVLETLNIFKDHLGKCMRAIFPALETAENTAEISSTVGILREACENLKAMMNSMDIIDISAEERSKIRGLQKTIDSFLKATDVSEGIRIQQVKCITEELFEDVLNIQEDLIHFTSQPPDKSNQEVRLIEIIHDVENNIAALEQYDFIDLSKASDLTSCACPQLAIELESSSFSEVENIIQTALIVIQDSVRENPSPDLLFVQDFLKTCNNEFTLLRCLSSKVPSYKKITRLLQAFNFLQTTINDFKMKKIDLMLSDQVNTCVTKFLVHADECLKDIQASLIKIVESQSDLLFQEPLSKIESKSNVLSEIMTNEPYMEDIPRQFQEIVNIVKPCIKSAKIDIIEELKQSHLLQEKYKRHRLCDRVEAFTASIENKMQNVNKETRSKLKNVLKCIEKHSSYNNATSTGQAMILVKCLSECMDIIDGQKSEISSHIEGFNQIPSKHEVEPEIMSILYEILKPIQDLNIQINQIQKTLLSGTDEKSISVDITKTECINIANQLEKILQGKMETLVIDAKVASLLLNVNEKIHTIQEKLKTVETVKNILELAKPLQEVEELLQNILISQKTLNRDEKGFTKDINANTGSLEQAVENFLSFKNYLLFSEFIGKANFDECMRVALVINRLLKLNGNKITPEINKIRKHYIQVLKDILTKFDWVNTEKKLEAKNESDIKILKNIFQNTYQLLAELDKDLNDGQEHATQLIKHIDQYIELIEVVEEISAVIRIEDLKESIEVAKELRESIAFGTDSKVSHAFSAQVSAEQTQLANKLHNAVIALQAHALDIAQELAPETYYDVLQRITKVTEQLQADLVAVTGVDVAVQAPFLKEKEDNNNIHTEEMTIDYEVEKKIETAANKDTEFSDKLIMTQTNIEIDTNVFKKVGLEYTNEIATRKINDNEALVDDNIKDQANLRSDNVRVENAVDIKEESHAHVIETNKTHQEGVTKWSSTETGTDVYIPVEKTTELTEVFTDSKYEVKAESGVDNKVHVKATEVMSLEVVDHEPVEDVKEVSQAQATETYELSEVGTIQMQSIETITETEIPVEMATELKGEPPVTKAEGRVEPGVENKVKVEAKAVVSPEAIDLEQVEDVKEKISLAQATEPHEEVIIKVQSTETVTATERLVETVAELKVEIPISEVEGKFEASVDDKINMGGKKLASAKITELQQSPDIKEEFSQAQSTETCELQTVGTIQVQSTKTVTETEAPIEMATELKEEPAISKAEGKVEPGVDDKVKVEAKELVNFETVDLETAEDIKEKFSQAQVTETFESGEEGTIKVQTTETVTPVETATELIGELPISKTEVKVVPGVEDKVSVETKEVLSLEIVNLEQAADVKEEFSQAQATETYEFSEVGTIQMQSTETISETEIPIETATELKGEPSISKAESNVEHGVVDKVKMEAKELMSFETVDLETAEDIKEKFSQAQVTETFESGEEGTIKVQTTETVPPVETTTDLIGELPISKAEGKVEPGVEGKVPVELKEVLSLETVNLEQGTDVKEEFPQAQSIKTYELSEVGTIQMQSTETVIDVVTPVETASELKGELLINNIKANVEPGIEDKVMVDGKEIVSLEAIDFEQVEDVKEKILLAQATEVHEVPEEGTIKVQPTETVTRTQRLVETATELKAEILISELEGKFEPSLADKINVGGKNLASAEIIQLQQTPDIKEELSEAQSTETCELQTVGTKQVQSTETVTETETPIEMATELKEEPAISKFEAKVEPGVDVRAQLEAKGVVNLEAVALESTEDVKEKVLQAQATETFELREKGTIKVQSTAAVTSDDTDTDLIGEIPIRKAEGKVDPGVEDRVPVEAKEVLSLETVNIEQAADVKEKFSQATETYELQKEGTIKVQSTETVTETVTPFETASKLKGELPINKAEENVENSLENKVMIEAKETVSLEAVDFEQVENVKEKTLLAQATEAHEVPVEGIINVQPTATDRLVETATELKAQILISEVEGKLEPSVDDKTKVGGKEVASAEITELQQSPDIKEEFSQAQSTETCELQTVGTIQMQSTETVTEIEKPIETATKLKGEPQISKAEGSVDLGVDDKVKVEAKELVSFETVDVEPAEDVKKKVLQAQATETFELGEESTIKVQSTKTITETEIPVEMATELEDGPPVSKAEVKVEAGVDDKVKVEAKEVLSFETVYFEQAVDVKEDFKQAQATETCELQKEGIIKVHSTETITEKPTELKGPNANADLKYETIVEMDSDTVIQEISQEEIIKNSYDTVENVAVTELASPVLFEEIAVNENIDIISDVACETVEESLARAVVEHGGIIQHIEDFTANDIVEIVEEISSLTYTEELKETVLVAKELKHCIIEADTQALEGTVPLNEVITQKAKLAEKLQYSLTLLHTKALESAEQLGPIIRPENLQKISEIITHLQDDLDSVIVSAPHVVEEESILLFQDNEEDPIMLLDSLLQEIDTSIESTYKTENDTLKDTLDEVQTVIIKLKKDFDGANDSLNETLEDLECSVRSVQLQIIEGSPQELLKEACATLKLLVNNMSESKDLKSVLALKKDSNDKILEECSNKTEETMKLLENAANIPVKDLGNLKNVISCLTSLRDSLKHLRESFDGDAELLIEKGLEVTQTLSLLEDKLFSIEKDVESEISLKIDVKNNVLTAIHSVYASISHMRSVISSIQKSYMFENYGQPSKILLKAIKNAAFIANAVEEKKFIWKKLTKSLRGVFNHFEDIKFYINLDKTARLPSDAAFTKIILKELKSDISELLTHSMSKLLNVNNNVHTTLRCIEKNLQNIETRATMEVKTKIPIFREITRHVYKMCMAYKSVLDSETIVTLSDIENNWQSLTEKEQLEKVEDNKPEKIVQQVIENNKIADKNHKMLVNNKETTCEQYVTDNIKEKTELIDKKMLVEKPKQDSEQKPLVKLEEKEETVETKVKKNLQRETQQQQEKIEETERQKVSLESIKNKKAEEEKESNNVQNIKLKSEKNNIETKEIEQGQDTKLNKYKEDQEHVKSDREKIEEEVATISMIPAKHKTHSDEVEVKKLEIGKETIAIKVEGQAENKDSVKINNLDGNNEKLDEEGQETVINKVEQGGKDKDRLNTKANELLEKQKDENITEEEELWKTTHQNEELPKQELESLEQNEAETSKEMNVCGMKKSPKEIQRHEALTEEKKDKDDDEYKCLGNEKSSQKGEVDKTQKENDHPEKQKQGVENQEQESIEKKEAEAKNITFENEKLKKEADKVQKVKEKNKVRKEIKKLQEQENNVKKDENDESEKPEEIQNQQEKQGKKKKDIENSNEKKQKEKQKQNMQEKDQIDKTPVELEETQVNEKNVKEDNRENEVLIEKDDAQKTKQENKKQANIPKHTDEPKELELKKILSEENDAKAKKVKEDDTNTQLRKEKGKQKVEETKAQIENDDADKNKFVELKQEGDKQGKEVDDKNKQGVEKRQQEIKAEKRKDETEDKKLDVKNERQKEEEIRAQKDNVEKTTLQEKKNIQEEIKIDKRHENAKNKVLQIEKIKLENQSQSQIQEKIEEHEETKMNETRQQKAQAKKDEANAEKKKEEKQEVEVQSKQKNNNIEGEVKKLEVENKEIDDGKAIVQSKQEEIKKNINQEEKSMQQEYKKKKEKQEIKKKKLLKEENHIEEEENKSDKKKEAEERKLDQPATDKSKTKMLRTEINNLKKAKDKQLNEKDKAENKKLHDETIINAEDKKNRDQEDVEKYKFQKENLQGQEAKQQKEDVIKDLEEDKRKQQSPVKVKNESEIKKLYLREENLDIDEVQTLIDTTVALNKIEKETFDEKPVARNTLLEKSMLQRQENAEKETSQKNKLDNKTFVDTKSKKLEKDRPHQEKRKEKEEYSGRLSGEILEQESLNSLKTSEHYIKEYQYEPTRKNEKDKSEFVGHSSKDYSLDFPRPPGYREKSFDNKVESLDTLGLGKNATIYKAQTIILESQLRTSPSTYSEKEEPRRDREEWRSELRRSKALSEARSVASERRIVARDLKRKPVFSTYLTDRTAVEGSRVKLTCSVLSSSDPTITWYKNGVVLDNKLKYSTKFIDGLITLEVLNAVPNDSAEYSCSVANENGSVSTSANLKVYPSFEASPIPPTFTRSIRDTYHLAENELVLECRIRGQPLPTITWLKDDKSISTNERYQAYYLADGVCRLAIAKPTPEDSGKYTCKAENSVWSDHISHVVNFTGKENRLSPNLTTIERTRFNRQAMESRRPHFTNVLTDYKVVKGGTIGLQVEIRGSPTRVEWLREGRSVIEIYRNAKTFVEQGLYTLALSDVTEKESGTYTCRAWNNQENVDMNAAITVVSPNDLDGKPAIIVGRPEKDILISVGEDVNISFRVQGEPKPKVVFMKGIRDITTNQRVCKMTSDDYVKFTLKRSTISDAGTYCILVRNAYGCDRAFVTVVVRQRATSDNLISDWTYPMDDTALSMTERKFKSVPDRIPGEPSVVDGGSNWVSLAWPKPDPGSSAPVLAYKVESWLIGKEGGARWTELGITPLNTFDAFNLKQGEEYHFRITPRNRYGFGESVQTSTPIGVGLAGDRPEFVDILPGQLKVLINETANLTCSVKGRPLPEVTWMKNGHEIEEDKRIKTSFNGYNCCLTIDKIEIEDEGRYSCEASNVHGRASSYARLAVVTDRLIWEADAKLKRERSANAEGEYPPQFTMRLRDRRVQATYPVRLTCQVVGNPSPTITWFKDAEEVTYDSRHNKYQDEQFHTLEIAPTTLEDGGVYEAMARNSCGAVSCRCGLVVDKGIRAYVAPEFCCGLEPLYRISEGEELRISAVVEAYPSVGVTWYRNGARLRPSRRAVMTLDRDGQIELALASITHRDAGVYTCTASNEVGRASTSGKVEVVGNETPPKRTPPVVISPDVPYSKEPMFIRKPRSSEAREGDTVIIACEVVGDPKPEVYWLRDFLKPDYYRDSSHFKRVGDGPEYRFEIPHAKLDYTGAYSVVARNVHGETKAIISLQIKARDPSCSEEVHNIRYGRVDIIPRFDRNLTDLLSYDGDTVEFECRVSGNPEPDIRWFHYTELIRECPDFESTYDDGAARLKIKQVTADDEGTYTCEASNNLGKATSSACLVVYPPGEPNTLSQRLCRPPALLSAASTPRSTPRSTPARSVSRTPGPESRRVCSPSHSVAPTFYTYPFNKVVEEGENVVFQCAVKGLPSPWTTWDKDGVVITPTARITIREKDDMLRILEIEHVSIEDVGVYRITVENEFGRAEASARLEVITRSGKFYTGVRAYSASPRKSFPYRLRPSTSRD